MKKKLTLTLFIFLKAIAFSQETPPEYDIFIQKADSFYVLKDYKNAATNYSEAFKVNYWRGSLYSRYKSATAWTLISNLDSAFYQLKRISTRSKASYYDDFISDSNFISLHKDERWDSIIETEKQKKEFEEKDYNRPLIAILDTVLTNDQKYRHQLDSIGKKYGVNSKEIDAHWKIIQKQDSINLIQVEAILLNYGWLGSSVISNTGNSTLFLVIQHANLETQLKYLPIMKEAMKNGNANSGDVALLEDRVLLRSGKKQIYGSQVGRDGENENYFYVQPLEDPDNVDKRRAEVGLDKLTDYVSNWGIVWDVEQYKKDLPKIQKIYNRDNGFEK